VDVDGFLIEGQAGERVHQEIAELLIHVSSYVFTEDFILGFFLKFEGVLDIPG
jgi:hypothetical protein